MVVAALAAKSAGEGGPPIASLVVHDLQRPDRFVGPSSLLQAQCVGQLGRRDA